MSNYRNNFLQISDPHCHLWDVSLGYHAWLDNKNSQILGDVTPINKTYLAQDHLANNANEKINAHRQNKFFIKKIVHIESVPDSLSRTEVEYICELAKTTPELMGRVGGIDFLNNNLKSLLGFYQKTKLVIGVRQILNFYNNPGSKYSNVDQDYLKNKFWLENFSLLSDFGLMFEAQVNPGQLLGLAALAENNPDIIININHAGFPIKEFYEVWQTGIVQCAKHKNINIKLSGFGMFDHDWSASSVREIILFVIEKFGVDRCMFASNFPVDKLYKSYEDMMDNYFDVTSGFSTADQEKLFSQNATRVYCL